MTEVGGIDADVVVNGVPVEDERPPVEEREQSVAEILAPEPEQQPEQLDMLKPDEWRPEWMPPKGDGGAPEPEPQELEPTASGDDALTYGEEPIDRLLKPDPFERFDSDIKTVAKILGAEVEDLRAQAPEVLADMERFGVTDLDGIHDFAAAVEQGTKVIKQRQAEEEWRQSVEDRFGAQATYGPESTLAREVAELKQLFRGKVQQEEETARIVAEQDALLQQARDAHSSSMNQLIMAATRFGHPTPSDQERTKMGEFILDNRLLGADPGFAARAAYQAVLGRDPLAHHDRRRAEVVIPGKVISIPTGGSAVRERGIDDLAAASGDWPPPGENWRAAND